MNDETLRRLLQSADTNDADSRELRVEGHNLVAAVSVRRRRRTQRRALAACVAVAVAMGGWRSFGGRHDVATELAARSPADPPLTAAAAVDQWQRLEREAESRLRVIREVRDAEAAERAPAALGAVEASPELFAQETARSAAISLQNARLVDEEFPDSAAARREYQRIVERFPGTRWADQAAQSLRRFSG